jgi:hypothetical protein
MSLILDGTNGVSDIDGDASTPAIRGTDANTGIFFPAADTIAFSEGGSEAMRIDSSGNVAIGSTSALYFSRFTVAAPYNTTNGPFFADTRGQGTGTGGLLALGGKYNTAGDYRPFALIRGGKSNGTDGNSEGFLTFETNNNGADPTERARITSDGALLVGATSVSSVGGVTLYSHQKQAFVNGDTFSDQQASNMAFNSASGSNDSGASTCYLARYATAGAISPGALFKGYQDTTIVIKINNNGNITNTNNSYGSLSDAKLKENIVDAKSQWNDIKSLRVRNYNFKEETGYQTNRQIGLVAQEVEIVSPGLVIDFPENNDEVTKTINYSVLYMKAVKALQEAMERIETLEAQNAAFETRLAALENK